MPDTVRAALKFLSVELVWFPSLDLHTHNAELNLPDRAEVRTPLSYRNC